ncbi:MAG: aspartyl/asparaginyl beta-hydroxylase domain-containing protein [Myxococcota bacterium]
MSALDVADLMERLSRRLGGAGLERVEATLRAVAGEAPAPAPTAPLHEPTRLCFPGLRAAPWHDPASLPWAAAVQRETDAVRAELQALLQAEAAFYPYEDPYTLELGWRGWDTFVLYRKGRPHPANADRCPRTMAALAATPRAVRQGMFSRLRPGAHLAPHTGGVNVVLTCHLPLVVPEGCGLRVGGELRPWREGELAVFDDSFVHEAFNRGTADRLVLLWDIWHPDLAPVEIAALELLFPVFDRVMREMAA